MRTRIIGVHRLSNRQIEEMAVICDLQTSTLGRPPKINAHAMWNPSGVALHILH